MNSTYRLLFCLSALLLAACAEPAVDQNAVMTAVAGTVPAMLADDESEPSESNSSDASEEGSPADETVPNTTAVPGSNAASITVEIEVTREVIVAVDPPALGSVDRPVQLILAPTFDAQITEFRGQAFATAISETLGLHTELLIPATFEETIALMCEHSDSAVATAPAFVYTEAERRCGAAAALVSQRSGMAWHSGMITVGTNSGIFTLEGLAEKTWAVDSLDSLENSLYFSALFQSLGIEPGEIVESGGDSSSMLALANGEVDFATASYTPPLLPRLERLWEYGVDDPEIWRVLGIPPSRHPRGVVIVLALAEDGGYRIRDARSAIFDVEPDIFATTRILDLSAQLPNEIVAFGSGVPIGVVNQITDFLFDYAGPDGACAESVCSGDFYSWTGFELVGRDTFSPLQFIRETLALSGEDIVSLYDD